MKFFYQLERFELGEYVIVRVEEDGFNGTGAVIPNRKKGENYKTVMGAIEEYRRFVEISSSHHFAVISQRLLKHFPNHPEVTFAISAAFFELYAKKNGISVEELLMCQNLQKPMHIENWNGKVVLPEEMGGITEVLSLPDKDKTALLIKDYPNGEMKEILYQLARYFAGYIKSGY